MVDTYARTEYDLLDFGTDIQTAINVAISGITTARGATLYIPPIEVGTSKPLYVTSSKFTLRGSGKVKTYINPQYAGPVLYCGPPYTLPTVAGITTSGGLSYSFNGSVAPGANQGCYSIKDVPGGHLTGRTSWTIECYVKLTALSGVYNTIASSGASRFIGETLIRSLAIAVNPGGTIEAYNRTGGVYNVCTSSTTLVPGTRYHIALSWTGATLRLFINGIQEASVATVGTFVQEVWEDFTLGYAPLHWPFLGVATNPINGAVDSFRIDSTALYTANFTAPTAKLPELSTTLFLMNCNEVYGGVFSDFQSNLGDGYMLYRPVTLLDAGLAIRETEIEGLSFVGAVAGNNIGPCVRTLFNGRFREMTVEFFRAGLQLQENCYQSEVRDLFCQINPRAGLSLSAGACLGTMANAMGVMYFEELHLTGGTWGFLWGNGSGGQVDHLFHEATEETLWSVVVKSDNGTQDSYTFNDLLINDENGGGPGHHLQYAIVCAGNRNVVFNGGLLGLTNSNLDADIFVTSGGGAVTVVGMQLEGSGADYLVQTQNSSTVNPVTLINVYNPFGTPLSNTPEKVIQLPGPITDDFALVKGNTDATKQFRIECDTLITTGNTRVGTVPNGNFTFAGIDLAATWTALQTFGSALLSATAALLTRPRITTSIDDANGNEVLVTPATASAVNEITVRNAATGTDPSVEVSGGDANRGLTFIMKGTGVKRVTGPEVITAAVANSFSVGRQGATNPGLNVDASTASCVTGFNLASLAAGSGVTFTVTSSGTDESAQINAKGAGNVGFQSNRMLVSSTGKVTSKAGTGASPTTATITHAGALYENVSVVGNVGGGEDDLHSTTIEANTFAENNDSADFEVAGSWSAGASTRTTRLYYGGTVLVAISSASTDQKWSIKGKMIRIDATNMRVLLEAHLSPAAGTAPTQHFFRESTLTVTHANNNTFKCTGESTGATNNDVTQTASFIWKASAP